DEHHDQGMPEAEEEVPCHALARAAAGAAAGSPSASLHHEELVGVVQRVAKSKRNLGDIGELLAPSLDIGMEEQEDLWLLVGQDRLDLVVDLSALRLVALLPALFEQRVERRVGVLLGVLARLGSARMEIRVHVRIV